ncbi:MAG: cytochrome c oxidase subunit II, partial [Chloroflexota bacterium]
AVSNPPSAPGVEVRVVAHQWWWEFKYPDLGVVTANEMYIPVGKVVNLTLESQDVIHSFWVPNLAGKMDMIPNRINSMWLQADEAKTYQGQCAEFCGIAHAHMRFLVIAVTQPEFDAWVQGQKSPPALSGEAERGAALFDQRGCASCHLIKGTAAKGQFGPNLTLFGSHTSVAAGTLENDAEGKNLARWLHDPQLVKPGTKMPNMKLGDEDIAALVAYLKSLK